MASSNQVGKKSLIGLVSTLSWLTLLVAFLATAVIMTVDSVKHIGSTASAIVQHLSENQSTIDSLLNEFKKNADPRTVAEIDKNRSTIDSTIASLAGDKKFQDSLAATLNKISEAILDGSSSVKVDFGPLAAAIADKVNAASKTPLISKKDLAKLKPQRLDLSKQSQSISDARHKINQVALAWLIWLVLLGVLYLLTFWKVLRTAGWQLLSIGILFLIVRFVAPVVIKNLLDNSSMVKYQRDLVPEVLDSLTKPMMTLSIIATVFGLLFVVGGQLLQKRLRSKMDQSSPSVVA